MLYLQEILDVQPGMVDEYQQASADHLIAGWNRYVKTVGFFKNACRHCEAMAFWELGEDGSSIDGLGGFILVDREGKAWQRLALKYRQDWYDTWLESVPFSPTVDQISERQKQGDFTGNKLYYWDVTRVLPGKMGEFLEAMETDLVPMEEKRGMKLHWGQLREARLRDPAFRQWMEKAAALRTEWSYKFWIPSDWSLLQ